MIKRALRWLRSAKDIRLVGGRSVDQRNASVAQAVEEVVQKALTGKFERHS